MSVEHEIEFFRPTGFDPNVCSNVKPAVLFSLTTAPTLVELTHPADFGI